MPITISVRLRHDGLASAREAEPDILMVFKSGRPSAVGERLELPDGSFGQVMTTIERSNGSGITQSVFVERL